MIKLTFLGTSSGIPTATRNMSCTAIEFPNKRVWLVDCGAGTQHQMIKHGMWVGRIDKIFITHLHGDHCYDIVGLLALRGMRKISSDVEIIGPKGIKELIDTTRRLSQLYLPFNVRILELEPNQLFDIGWRSQEEKESQKDKEKNSNVLSNPDEEDETPILNNSQKSEIPSSSSSSTDHLADPAPEESKDWYIQAVPLDHRIACFGYIFSEKDQLGSFDSSIAISKGVTGSMLGKLAQAGEVIVNGITVKKEECLRPPFKGRKFTILGDTCECSENVHRLSYGSDVMVHEATFDKSLKDLAMKSTHSTTEMAVECALKCCASTLIITHFSARYIDHGAKMTVQDLLEEAQSFHNFSCQNGSVSSASPESNLTGAGMQILAANDFWSFEISPKRENLKKK